MQFSKKQKTFTQFLVTFLDCRTSFKIFEKKMVFIAYVFPRLRTVKEVARLIFKRLRFRQQFESQHTKVP